MISRNHKAKANEVNFGAPNQIKANISNSVTCNAVSQE